MIRLTRISSFALLFVPLLLLGIGRGAPAVQAEPAEEQVETAAPLAACTPDTSDMLAYWPFDDGQGATSFDDLVSDPGNPAGCTDDCPSSDAGKVGTAFTYNNNQVTVPDDALLPYAFDFADESNLSFEMWFKTAQVCTGNKVFLGRDNGGNLQNIQWWIGCGPDDSVPDLYVAIFNMQGPNTDDLTLIGDTLINDNAWHHLVAVRDNDKDTNYIYLDGQLEKSGALNFTGQYALAESSPLKFGYFQSGFSFQGTLDEVAVYTRALTLEEVQAHYNGGVGQSYCNSDPVAVDDGLSTDEDTPVGFTGADLLADDSDPDGAEPSLDSVDTESAQGGAIADLGSGNYQYTPPADFNGADSFHYTITDGIAAPVQGTVNVTVGPLNDPPEVTPPADQEDDEGDSPSLQIVATDLDGDTLTYDATGLPPDLSINTSTGLISGTLTQTSGGGYTVTVTVSDGTDEAEVTFTWTVNPVNLPPELTDPGDQSNLEGEAVSLDLTATDADNDDLAFSATGLPPGLSIDPATGEISGTIAAGAAAGSPYTVTARVTEVGTADLFYAEVDFTWTVKRYWSVYLPIVLKSP